MAYMFYSSAHFDKYNKIKAIIISIKLTMSNWDQKPLAYVSTQERSNESNESDNDSNNGMVLAMKMMVMIIVP